LLFNRRLLFPHLLEILFHVGLQGNRNLVAADLGARLGVLHGPVAVLGMQLLVRGLHFDRSFAANRLRTPADDLTDLAHRRQLLRFFQPLLAILAADAATGLLAGLLG